MSATKGESNVELKLKEIAEVLGGEVVGPAENCVITSISTDSRTLRPGDCFVALRGSVFDGHNFVENALRAGAKALIVTWRVPAPDSIPQLIVPDTLYALGEIARLWRQKLSHVQITVVVGSSGKTTVKEMAAKIVAATRPTLATEGNLNNLIGVPLTLFRLQPQHRAAVIELGMNASGELKRLVEIVQPDCVALTNIRNAHIGMFASKEDLYLAKVESLRYAAPTATFVINRDDPATQRAQSEFGQGHRVITFGYAADATVRAADVQPMVPFGYRFRLCIESHAPVDVELRLFGEHNVANALAAAAIAHFFDIAPPCIAEQLKEFRSAHNRSQVEEVAGIYFIRDYYNASPAAMESALLSLKDFAVPGRRYAVLADMLELGAWEHEYHRDVGKVAAAVGLDQLFCYGPRAAVIAEAAREEGLPVKHYESAEELAKDLLQALKPGDLVLIKGSRLMKLEKVFEMLKGALTAARQ